MPFSCHFAFVFVGKVVLVDAVFFFFADIRMIYPGRLLAPNQFTNSCNKLLEQNKKQAKQAQGCLKDPLTMPGNKK